MRYDYRALPAGIVTEITAAKTLSPYRDIGSGGYLSDDTPSMVYGDLLAEGYRLKFVHDDIAIFEKEIP